MGRACSDTGRRAPLERASQTATVNITSFAGQSVTVQVEAADASTGSLVEAGVDDVRITAASASAR